MTSKTNIIGCALFALGLAVLVLGLTTGPQAVQEWLDGYDREEMERRRDEQARMESQAKMKHAVDGLSAYVDGKRAPAEPVVADRVIPPPKPGSLAVVGLPAIGGTVMFIGGAIVLKRG